MIDSRVRPYVPPELIKAVEEAIAGGEGPGLKKKVWTLVNHKGGVGKTFDTLALAWVLAVCYGLHVLVVDMDPQANASRQAGYGAFATEHIPTLSEALKLNQLGGAKQIVKPFKWGDDDEPIGPGSIDLLPARLDLEVRAEEAAITDAISRVRAGVLEHNADLLDVLEPIFSAVVGNMHEPRARLKNLLGGGFLADYDIVLIDCPPSLGHLTQNAYVASDGVLLCTKASYDSLNGAVRAEAELHKIRKALGVPDLDIHGVLLTDLQIVNRKVTVDRHHGSVRSAEQSIKQLKKAFGDKLWLPFMERKSVLAENSDYGVPIIDSLGTADRSYVTEVMIKWGAKLLEVSLG